jgi:hypothetical protein
MSSFAVKTIDDVLTEARLMVNDAIAPFRNTDATLVAYLNSGLRQLYTLRPDAFIGNFSTGILSANAIPTYDEADLGTSTAFPADDRMFFNPVVAYVAARIELGDDEFTDNSRSTQLFAAAVQQLQG